MLGPDLAAMSVQAAVCVQEDCVQSMLCVESAAGQTPIQPLCSAGLSHARNKSNAARNTEQMKLCFVFIEVHCALSRVSPASSRHAVNG